MSITELITELEKARDRHGDVRVFSRGWNDSGIEEIPSGVDGLKVRRTGENNDGEIRRIWEQSPDGEAAVLIGYL